MEFNYSKLLGRIKECGYTQKTLAETIGINSSTLSAKLNNQYHFTVKEMNNICKALNLSRDDVGAYFFAERVQKS